MMSMPKELFLAVLILCSGCSLFLPVRQDPLSDAKKKEAEVCPPRGAPHYPPALFDPHSVVQVEPIYSSVRTGRSGNESRLQGAKLRLRPIEGMTVTSLEALLICHQARRVLGRSGEVELDNDPYWLPRGWVSISVETEGGNFVLSLKGRDIKEANEILLLANAFAGKS